MPQAHPHADPCAPAGPAGRPLPARGTPFAAAAAGPQEQLGGTLQATIGELQERLARREQQTAAHEQELEQEVDSLEKKLRDEAEDKAKTIAALKEEVGRGGGRGGRCGYGFGGGCAWVRPGGGGGRFGAAGEPGSSQGTLAASQTLHMRIQSGANLRSALLACGAVGIPCHYVTSAQGPPNHNHFPQSLTC